MIRKLLALGLPLAIGFISQTTISFTDAMLISRLGNQDLSGATLGISLFSLVMLMGIGILLAFGPHMARAFRQDDFARLRKWFAQGIWLALILGVVGMAILYNTGRILTLFNVSDDLAQIAQQYNQGAAPGIVFLFLFVHSRCLMSSVGKPGYLTIIMLLTVPVNFLVAYVAILGFNHTGGAGVLGGGLSSSLIRAVLLISAVCLLTRGRPFRHLSLTLQPGRLDWQAIRTVLAAGLPMGVRIALSEGFLPTAAFLIAGFGLEATTVHSFALRTESLITVFTIGLSGAAGTLAAWCAAENDWVGLRRLRYGLLSVAFGYVLLVGGAIALFYPQIQRYIYDVTDAHIISMMWNLLPLLLIAFLFNTLGSCYNGFLVGMMDTRWPTLVVIGSYWVIGLGGGFIVARYFHAGFYSYWIALGVSNLIIAAYNFYRTGVHVQRMVRERLHEPQPAVSG
ncbi:MATE family efflux transporter [Pantoea sp. A4]|uniref:MATE family efflux transporter n=1 Tax=Pantoea sp. A4 TaxID=1225184 RepID=UPI00037CF356|nr:MATE family efflux transporter [Pantoea sp. A4]